MNDFINKRLVLAVQKNQTNTQTLQRYFKIRYGITVGEDVLERRLLLLKPSSLGRFI